MALQLNLLHEEFTEERQRKRDPLKLGVIALCVVGALMLLFYVTKAYQTLAVKNRLSAVEHEWSKVEPKVTAAQKRIAELNSIISTTTVLNSIIDHRFFWAPLLQTLSSCVAPNAQITSFDGTIADNSRVTLSIEGTAAAREPRAAAEDLRQLLSERLEKIYGEVTVEFKTLEDLDSSIALGGATLPMARYTISVSLVSPNQESTTPLAARVKK